MELRRTQARADGAERRQLVTSARALIYKNGLALKSKRVEDILHPQSLVPIQVSLSKHSKAFKTEIFLINRLHFRED
jgi:hypothetical protein